MKVGRNLGSVLVNKGLISKEILDRALEEQKRSGKKLGELLVELGFISEDELVNVLAEQLQIERVDAHSLGLHPELLSLFPMDYVVQHKIFPVRRKDDTLELAMVDPFDIRIIDDVMGITGLQVKPLLASSSEIAMAYQRHQDLQNSANKVIAELAEESEETIEDVGTIQDVSEVPIVKVVNLMIYEAVQGNASDIHVQPGENHSVVRYRIDGILRDVMHLPGRIHADLISRLKVMANLDITKRRLPQDGRIRVTIEGRKIDLRMSTLPTIYGEKAVLRVLDQGRGLVRLDTIGFAPDSLEAIRHMLLQPQGLILVIGPTGSGKTTTLYSFLDYLNVPEKNIITVEDPVEYRIPGISQVQVQRHGGLDFADGLKAVVRQDPDIIMVGEIRDSETASIAVRAALTGHLVLSTLHTNDAASSLVRLIDLGVEPFLISATLIGIVAQRLVRRLCDYCKQPVEELQNGYAQFLGTCTANTVYRAVGCNRCGGTGFKGRIPIEEVLLMSREIRRQIRTGLDEHEIREYAVSQGMIPLKENACKRVLAGETTVSEAIRAVYMIDDILDTDIEFLEALK